MQATLKWILVLVPASWGLVSVSCKVGPDYVTPPSGVGGRWMEREVVTNRAPGVGEIYWWRQLQDPVLTGLVEAACRSNLSLQMAGTRVLQARARLNQSIGNLFPQQQVLAGEVDYTHLNDGLVSRLPGVQPDYVSDQLLFSASWELDFWGKYRRAIESERAGFLGTVAAYEDALVTLIADVASSYVNLRTAEERLRVASHNAELQKESLRIARAQFKAGETGERDVQQASTQLAQTQAQIPPLEQARIQARNALAVLLGETPERMAQQLEGAGNIPAAPARIAAGIPRDLLRRRPDVRAAGLAAASQCALIGVAKAQMYPSFSLSGQFGAAANNEGSTSLEDIFNWQHRVVTAGGGFVFPVFNYGRLKNQVRIQDAQFEEAVLTYQNTVLAAQQEVEDGLAAFGCQQRTVVWLQGAAFSARRSTELAMIQYRGGQTDYTTVLSAEQAQLAVEDALASAQGTVVLEVIAVYRALGGGWQVRLGGDVVSEAVKAEMARRTDWGRMLEPARHLPESSGPKSGS